MLSPMKTPFRLLALACFVGSALTSPTALADTPPLPDPAGPAPEGPLPSTTNPEAASAEPPAPSEYNPAADTDPAALGDFHDNLAPYGTWVDDSSYGTVWVPSSTAVGADFAPYVSDGHWALTEDSQWLWVSDYNWGWAPFHYGRWVWIGGRGWSWIPGRVYSPAWVVWRTGYYDDYYVGWAPMPPTWYWWGGVAVGLGYVPPAPYVFCSSRYVFSPGVRSYIVPAGRVSVIAPRTRTYVAANAAVAGSYHPLTRGPSVAEAHIPAAAVPATRVSHDPRAMAFSRSSSAQFAARPVGPTAQPGNFGRSPGYPQHAAPNFASRPTAPSAEVSRPAPNFTPRPMSPAPSPAPRSFSPAPMVPRSNPAPAVHSNPSIHMRGGRR
jgi:hypothetical protein